MILEIINGGLMLNKLCYKSLDGTFQHLASEEDKSEKIWKKTYVN